MCGLAGLCRLGSEGDAEHETALVQTMCDRIAHRGRDDSGVLHRGGACLGSRRLSIIDLSPAGHMPMQDDSGRWAIAYNGEVYNFAEIREELRALGHDFRSATDTEVASMPSWSGARRPWTASSTCSRSPCTTLRPARSIWCATASASSRSTTPSPTGMSSSAPR